MENKEKYDQIAELEQQNEKLEKQLLWYKSFFDNATDAVFILQPETWNVLDANDYAAILLGKSKDELIGSSISQFRRIFKLLKKSSSPIVLSELTLETNNGNNLMVEVSGRFVKHNNQELIQAIARDVSEQHALTDKLVQADKMVLLGQLSAGVSHEIRNPLAAVNLNLQVLKRNTEEESPNYNYVKTALQGVDRISRIVEVTLNFSRPTMPDIQEIDFNQLLRNTLELVSSVIKRKEIKVEITTEKNLPLIAADNKQMQQVFINLIKNAADAIETKGVITIHTYLEQAGGKNDSEFLVVSVKDTGEGIVPEDISKIFNPFFTRKSDGTGLGLPITQRIMHQHNGIIDVESKLGEGTTFYVKLPVNR